MAPTDVIRLDNDIVLERVKISVQGWTLVLDPRAYTVPIEILLNDWPVKETKLLTDDPTGETSRDYLAGLLEAVLQAKPLPLDLADPSVMIGRVEQSVAEGVRTGDFTKLTDWLDQSRQRLAAELNPGWTKDVIKERLSGVGIHSALFFYGRLGNGVIRPSDLQSLMNPPEDGVPSQSRPESPHESSAVSSVTSSEPTRARTRRKAS